MGMDRTCGVDVLGCLMRIGMGGMSHVVMYEIMWCGVML